ncbi:MAG: RsmG family class I SAM-dependent methyltransferase [Acidimicrobiia bacterium]
MLEDARTRGYLGPEPVERHLAHSASLADAIGTFDGTFLDLGSGGGVPGLVLAVQWTLARGVLLESQRRRCAFLETAVARLGLQARISVRCGRAEHLARDPELRGAVDLVVARSFGRPAVTAECAVGFLGAGGLLVVSEPPEGTADQGGRWPEEGLGELGLGPAVPVRAGSAGVVVMVAQGAPDNRWPRRDGRPAKSPRW